LYPGWPLWTLVSFIITAIGLHIFITRGGIGITVDDPNKPTPRRVLTGGGLVGVMVLIITYCLQMTVLFLILASVLTISLAISLYDDLRGIKKWNKVPLMLLPAIPLSVAGFISPLWNPQVLWINLGWLYWVLVVPVAVAGFSNGGNIIAGYDGMEVGIYLTISFLYLVIGILSGNLLVISLSGPLVGMLAAMIIYNWYPSKVLLGNVGSFPIGAILGLIPLIGHFEYVLPIIFLPHIIEFLLQIKYRNLKYSVFGRVDDRGIIHDIYGNKSVIHWIMNLGEMTEKRISMVAILLEIILCIFALFIFFIL